jgi:hypothetical protein
VLFYFAAGATTPGGLVENGTMKEPDDIDNTLVSIILID